MDLDPTAFIPSHENISWQMIFRLQSRRKLINLYGLRALGRPWDLQRNVKEGHESVSHPRWSYGHQGMGRINTCCIRLARPRAKKWIIVAAILRVVAALLS